jgi:hypothetical protein
MSVHDEFDEQGIGLGEINARVLDSHRATLSAEVWSVELKQAMNDLGYAV